MPTPPSKPRSTAKRLALGCGCATAIGLALLLIAGLTLYWLWSGQPKQWAAVNQSVAGKPVAQLQADAAEVENRLPSQVTELRGEVNKPDTRTIRITVDEANAWLSQRARPWAASQGVTIPPQVGRLAVWTDAGDIVLGVELKTSKVQQVFSAAITLSVDEAGLLFAKLGSVKAGRVPVPVASLLDRIGVRDDPRFAEVSPWIDRIIEGLTLEPVGPIDDTRQVRVVDIEVTDDAVELTIRTEPRG